MPKNKDARYKIGAAVKYPFCPPSEVVGIDNYTLSAFDGKTRHWASYTLTSEKKGPFSRWWIVNVPKLGPYFLVAAKRVPKDAIFDPALSGLVELKSEGDAALSSPKGTLAVYRAKKGNMLYSQEVFDGAPRLVFAYKPFTP
jgi:hypothetical protein